MAAEDPGELELVAAAAQEALPRGPQDFTAVGVGFSVVSDEKAVLDLERGVVSGQDELVLELRKGKWSEDRGRVRLHWSPSLEAYVLQVLLHRLLFPRLVSELHRKRNLQKTNTPP